MAVQSSWIWDESFISTTSASYATNQFFIVTLSTAGTGASGLPQIVLCASATEGVNGAIGVLQDTPKQGQPANVRLLGISKVVATTSAAVTFGSLVTCNAAGFACVADTTGQQVLGRCIAASTTLALGAYAEVLMTGPYGLQLV